MSNSKIKEGDQCFWGCVDFNFHLFFELMEKEKTSTKPMPIGFSPCPQIAAKK
jgi:hypothetical protein